MKWTCGLNLSRSADWYLREALLGLKPCALDWTGKTDSLKRNWETLPCAGVCVLSALMARDSWRRGPEVREVGEECLCSRASLWGFRNCVHNFIWTEPLSSLGRPCCFYPWLTLCWKLLKEPYFKGTLLAGFEIQWWTSHSNPDEMII